MTKPRQSSGSWRHHRSGVRDAEAPPAEALDKLIAQAGQIDPATGASGLQGIRSRVRWNWSSEGHPTMRQELRLVEIEIEESRLGKPRRRNGNRHPGAAAELRISWRWRRLGRPSAPCSPDYGMPGAGWLGVVGGGPGGAGMGDDSGPRYTFGAHWAGNRNGHPHRVAENPMDSTFSVERETGLEPATYCLEGSHSTN